MYISRRISRKQLLDTIAVLASTPPERLSEVLGTHVSIPSETSVAAVDSQVRLQRLYQLVKADDKEQEKHLLAQLQLSHEQVICSLSSSLPREVTSQPRWVIKLRQILCNYATGMPEYKGRTAASEICLKPEEPVPFEELLLPFIRYAREQLLALVPTRPLLLRLDAYCDLERWLLNRLVELAGQALQDAFANFCMRHSSLGIPTFEKDGAFSLYKAFVFHYGGEGLLPLFVKYSMLARLLVLRVEQWIETCKEFLQRLEEDREAIEQCFQYDQPAGPIMRIQAGCSDPHRNGRSVFILRFSNGHKLVYKPRSLEADHAFFRLCAWINAHGLSLQMKGLRVLSRATHGWVEYVEHSPCQTREEVQRYYRRAGQLVCLFYVLQTSDMHYENLIASGEYPIPIDLETVMTPRAVSLSQDAALPDHRQQIQDAIDYSVYQSTLLPMKLPILGRTLDLSFLGRMTGFEAPYKVLRWKDINTDAMRLVYEVANVEVGKSAVVLDGTLVRSCDHIEDIVTGFRTMYNLLAKYRDDLQACWGPLVSFVGRPIRYVFRATFIYEKLLLRLAYPDFLCDGVDRWIELQVFKRPLLKNKADSRFWAAIDAEVRSLQRLDVPLFTVLPEGNDLLSDEGTVIENFFCRSALDQVRACLAQLRAEDLEHQVDLIRDAFVNASVIPVEVSTR